MASNNELKQRLQALNEAYTKQLPDKLKVIAALWQKLIEHWDYDTYKELHRQIHSLAGSGTTFGYSQLSQHAKLIENTIKSLQQDSTPAAEQQDDISTLIHQLAQTIDTPDPAQTFTIAGTEIGQRSDRPATLYILEDDTELAGALRTQLEEHGCEVMLFDRPEQAEKALGEKAPDVLIVDIMLTEGGMEGIRFVQQAHAGSLPSLPVIFISNRNDLQARLEAVRAGGDVYLTKPLNMVDLIGHIERLTTNRYQTPYRILIVDDDRELADHYVLTLESAGMEAYAISNPMEIMKALAEFKPDLLLLDVHMPHCNGLELAKVIRQEGSYTHLPIVFLSTESNMEMQFAALNLGGDDFLTKPVDSKHLISAMYTRAQRARQIAALVMRDGLTGLINHTKILEQLQQEILRAARTHTPLSFVMLDLDNFKAINDSYGHMTGDEVIRNLAAFLQQQLRKTDIVGRYGGEEFAIILPDTTLSKATQLINRIRQDFARFTHHSNETTFHVTFSAGIGFFPKHPDFKILIESADRALYKAKQQGRNQVIEAME